MLGSVLTVLRGTSSSDRTTNVWTRPREPTSTRSPPGPAAARRRGRGPGSWSRCDRRSASSRRGRPSGSRRSTSRPCGCRRARRGCRPAWWRPTGPGPSARSRARPRRAPRPRARTARGARDLLAGRASGAPSGSRWPARSQRPAEPVERGRRWCSRTRRGRRRRATWSPISATASTAATATSSTTRLRRRGRWALDRWSDIFRDLGRGPVSGGSGSRGIGPGRRPGARGRRPAPSERGEHDHGHERRARRVAGASTSRLLRVERRDLRVGGQAGRAGVDGVGHDGAVGGDLRLRVMTCMIRPGPADGVDHRHRRGLHFTSSGPRIGSPVAARGDQRHRSVPAGTSASANSPLAMSLKIVCPVDLDVGRGEGRGVRDEHPGLAGPDGRRRRAVGAHDRVAGQRGRKVVDDVAVLAGRPPSRSPSRRRRRSR